MLLLLPRRRRRKGLDWDRLWDGWLWVHPLMRLIVALNLESLLFLLLQQLLLCEPGSALLIQHVHMFMQMIRPRVVRLCLLLGSVLTLMEGLTLLLCDRRCLGRCLSRCIVRDVCYEHRLLLLCMVWVLSLRVLLCGM